MKSWISGVLLQDDPHALRLECRSGSAAYSKSLSFARSFFTAVSQQGKGNNYFLYKIYIGTKLPSWVYLSIYCLYLCLLHRCYQQKNPPASLQRPNPLWRSLMPVRKQDIIFCLSLCKGLLACICLWLIHKFLLFSVDPAVFGWSISFPHIVNFSLLQFRRSFSGKGRAFCPGITVSTQSPS